MNSFFAQLGHVMMLAGLSGVLVVQLIIFILIIKVNVVKAVLALMIPGFLLYYVWRSENKMPRLLGTWAGGLALFIFGVIINGYTS